MTERRPGVWLGRVFVDGRQVAKTFRGTRKAVKAEVAAWEAEVLGRSTSHLGATVADLLTMWQEARVHEWQPTTVRDHRSRAARIVEDIGTVRLVDLDPLRVDGWLAHMRRRGVGAGAIRGRVSTLKAAASCGVSRRMLRSNPVVDAAPRVRNGRRAVRPEPDQVVALLTAAAEESRRAALALRLAALTGAREAEIVALAWDDLSGDTLRIGRQRHGLGGETVLRDRTKTGRERTVTLDAATVAGIEAWQAEADAIVGAPTQWMLAEPGAADPPSPRWLYEVFMRAGKRAGVPVGRTVGFVLHDLRHWAASTALRDGHDPVTVAARLGHSPDTLSASRQEGAVTDHNDVTVTLPADVNQIDETGFVWAFLDDATEPDRVRPGALIVAGDAVEPFLARVVEVFQGPGGSSIVAPRRRRRARGRYRRAPTRSPPPAVVRRSLN
jgi:integrase